MKKYCDEFISLAAENNSFIKLFPYEDTLSMLSTVEIHSDEETTPEKKNQSNSGGQLPRSQEIERIS
jgi:hypothetical protein